jgi:hypothetical protein
MTTDSALLDEITGMLIECDLFMLSHEIHSVARYSNISRIAKGDKVFSEGDSGLSWTSCPKAAYR